MTPSESCCHVHSEICTFQKYSSCRLNCSCIALKAIHYTLIYTLQVLYFFSGINSTLLEIIKNLRDMSKKWMRTPEAGDHGVSISHKNFYNRSLDFGLPNRCDTSIDRTKLSRIRRQRLQPYFGTRESSNQRFYEKCIHSTPISRFWLLFLRQHWAMAYLDPTCGL